MTSQVVTVSRQLGSRGSYIAARVAGVLGWRYVDREVIQRAASAAGIPPDALREDAGENQDVPTTAAQIVSAIGELPPVPVIASATLRESYYSDEVISALVQEEQLTRAAAAKRVAADASAYDQLTQSPEIARELALALAEVGSIVLVGRGAQVVLQSHSGACHVRVHAPASLRAERLTQRTGIDLQVAHRQIRDSDRARARHLAHGYGRAWDDVDLYHLVINTGRVNVEMATNLIVSMVERPVV